MSEERPAEGEGIFREMRLLHTRMGLMAFSIDYLIENNAPSDIITKHLKAEHERLSQAVARITGGSVEDIADKDKRTTEQTRIMQELSGKSQLLRMKSI